MSFLYEELTMCLTIKNNNHHELKAYYQLNFTAGFERFMDFNTSILLKMS